MNTSPPPSGPSSTSKTVWLTPLTSIRFFAALHILIFHIHAFAQFGKQSPERGLALPIFDQLPGPLVNWIRHGFCSTSLFFLISGYILAYLYIRPDGRMSVTSRVFWISRGTRIYPLHIVVLVLVLPFVVMFALGMELTVLDLLLSGLLAILLLQAWVPPYAMIWNFPTWALSAVAFFYLAFPVLVYVFRNLSRVQQAAVLAALPFISLMPSVVYLWIHPHGGESMSFWNEWVMRTPLLWLPHFAMGMLLARLFAVNRFDLTWRERSQPVGWRRWLSWGDLALLAVIAITALNDRVPNFILRHGALAPLYLVAIHDLARDRGCMSRLLSLPGMSLLGEASFSIFMLQFPAIILVTIVAGLVPLPSSVVVVGMVIATVCVSLLSTWLFEKPVARLLRRRLLLADEVPQAVADVAADGARR